MNRNRWRKIVLACFIVGALVFSFWYGGDAPGLQGFSIREDSEADAIVTDEVTSEERDADENSAAALNTTYESWGTDDRPDNDNTADRPKADSSLDKKSEGFSFKSLFMKIKQTGSAKTKKNPQLNKKAQKNANKAADASAKKNKKNSSSNKNNNNNSANKSEGNNSNANNISDNSPSSDSNLNDDSSNESTSLGDTDNDNSSSAGNSSEDGNAASRQSVSSNKDEDSNSISCTIYITCASVLDHMDELTDSAKKVIPKDGIMLNMTEVKVKRDATVFDVLQRAARDNKVHLEYNYTPAYKTYYIEGIGNLYQFDAGNLSGWMYSVNGEFPGVGCSGYKVKNGDVIHWVYTCSFGKDVTKEVQEDEP